MKTRRKKTVNCNVYYVSYGILPIYSSIMMRIAYHDVKHKKKVSCY